MISYPRFFYLKKIGHIVGKNIVLHYSPDHEKLSQKKMVSEFHILRGGKGVFREIIPILNCRYKNRLKVAYSNLGLYKK